MDANPNDTNVVTVKWNFSNRICLVSLVNIDLDFDLFA